MINANNANHDNTDAVCFLIALLLRAVELSRGLESQVSFTQYRLIAFEDCLLWKDKWLRSRRERDGIDIIDMLRRFGDPSLLGLSFLHSDGSKRLRPAKRSGQPAMEGVATTDSGQADHSCTSSGNQPCR